MLICILVIPCKRKINNLIRVIFLTKACVFFLFLHRGDKKSFMHLMCFIISAFSRIENALYLYDDN